MIVRLLADQGEQNCAALQSKLDMPRVDLLVPPAPAARGGRHADPRGRHRALDVGAAEDLDARFPGLLDTLEADQQHAQVP